MLSVNFPFNTYSSMHEWNDLPITDKSEIRRQKPKQKKRNNDSTVEYNFKVCVTAQNNTF